MDEDISILELRYQTKGTPLAKHQCYASTYSRCPQIRSSLDINALGDIREVLHSSGQLSNPPLQHTQRVLTEWQIDVEGGDCR